jgi:hypothetical protein
LRYRVAQKGRAAKLEGLARGCFSSARRTKRAANRIPSLSFVRRDSGVGVSNSKREAFYLAFNEVFCAVGPNRATCTGPKSTLNRNILLAFEFGIIIAAFICGCWTRRVAVLFLPMIAAALALFAILVGNPIGLLTSVGGWIILDLMLVLAALVARTKSKLSNR